MKLLPPGQTTVRSTPPLSPKGLCRGTARFFLTLTGAITTQGTFWLYAGFGVAALLFFAFRLPETKNRSLEEISEEVTDEASSTLLPQ